MLPWPVWPLAGQSGLGQNTVARSMSILLALSSGLPRVWLDLRFCYKSASPRFSAELPAHWIGRKLILPMPEVMKRYNRGHHFGTKEYQLIKAYKEFPPLHYNSCF